LDEFKQVFLIGIVLGVIFVILAVFLLAISLVTAKFGYLFGAVIGLGVGGSLLWKSAPAFIPIKQQIPAEYSCPHCGAIVGSDAKICGKCNRPIEDN
jgi:hypothetical protein